MKPLRKLLDRIHPLFVKGGKFEKLYPAYEGLDTFLYTPGEVTSGNAHVRDAMDLKRLMSVVVLALGPCVYMAMYNTGLQANLDLAALGVTSPEGWRAALVRLLGLSFDPGSVLNNVVHGAFYFLPVYAVCMAVGGTWEAIFSIVRKHEINEGFLVTGLLFPLTLPASIPLWQVALGISFGVVIGKEVFGGTGKNFLNPALTARAFLYFAYPAQITGDMAVWSPAASVPGIDGLSGATPLGAVAAEGMKGLTETGVGFYEAFMGTMPGSMGETSVLCCLIGAAVLIVSGLGSWRIMVAVVIGGLATSGLLYWIGGATNPMFEMPPHWHLVLGGFAFGTVFMATDPVSAAMTDTGKWIYGVLVGFMSILIRVINPAFPEGIMLAILFGNVFAPVIDHYVIRSNIKRRISRTKDPENG